MFIGHLPSSLVAFNALPDSWKTKRNFYLGLLGSIFPDIDLIWLYGIAQHKEHHHNYPTHIPFFWFVTGLFALFCCDKKSSRISWLVFLINVFIHLALDTIVGEIAWAFPITRHKFVWFSVPNAYDWWVLNFVGHWTFLFELTLVIWAIILIKRYKFDLSKNQPFDKR